MLMLKQDLLGNHPASIYAMWLRRIVETHLTQAWDAPQTPEGEEEEEWFNNLWQKMDEKHRQRLWGLSADLHSLRDKETPPRAIP